MPKTFFRMFTCLKCINKELFIVFHMIIVHVLSVVYGFFDNITKFVQSKIYPDYLWIT